MSTARCLTAGLVLFASLAAVSSASAQIDARMLRYPDVSATDIAFVYAGDIWVVPKAGGVAVRLSSPLGEELFPRFSPDGSRIAFSAAYDGNTDVYVVPTTGGEPVRLTHHPMADRVVGWHPDGERVLFASSRESGRQRYSQFYLVSAAGGVPEQLPVPYGEFASFSPDGTAVAYLPQTQAFRTWKRYRGGWSPNVWLFDLESLEAENISDSRANDEYPMWHGDTIYFLSDRSASERRNIWAYDRATRGMRQVTLFTDFDISFPSLGPDDIVFEAGGDLYRLDLETEAVHRVPVQVVTDRSTLRPRPEKVASLIRSASVSPTGQRAVFEARGELFTVPKEHGPVLNLTQSSGAAERYPRWSPDGRTLAYWSDRSGEYELTLAPADGTRGERTVTTLGPGYRYAPYWSPDSTKVAFIDEAMRIRVADVTGDAADVREIDKSPVFMGHPRLERFRAAWSADSRWLAWSRPADDTHNDVIWLYDTSSGERHRVTSGYFTDTSPVFDPDGRYLFYLSNRTFEPVYGSFDNSWTYPNATRIVAVPLRGDVASPLAPRNDAEEGDAEDSSAEENDGRPASTPGPVDIDLDGFESRVVVLPPAAGSYADLHAVEGKIVYLRRPRAGSGDTTSRLVYYDLEAREEKDVLQNVRAFEPTAKGEHLLVARAERYALIELKEKQSFDKPLRTDDMETVVDPRAEWRQMFTEAYRLQRDFFYDPNMHGLDWEATRDRYQALLDSAVTRWDVNFLLGELVGELNASHTYRGGGDQEQAPSRDVCMLGVDWALDDGAYRIARIVPSSPWDADVRSPLAVPGVEVDEGDYVLAVNGAPLDTTRDPWAAFQGLGAQTVMLTVGATPTAENARQVVVECLDDETELRFRAWIEERRRYVEEATDGRVGYVYVQSTGIPAQSELVRQFSAQWRKDGLIIDERFNSGGQIPDRFVELLNRPLLSHWAVRHGHDWQWPPVAHRGPMVMLINGWSGSGGDAFPFYFRESGLGPLIGTRTWGGLIGLSGAPPLVDGGTVSVPTFRMYDVQGAWFPEGHGVEPDIEVPEDPAQLARGVDPQLDRAIAEVLDRLADHPPLPERPAYERRVPLVLTDDESR